MECSPNYLNLSLKHLNCNVSIVGYAQVNGVELYGNQPVLSSSLGLEKKLMLN